MLIRVFFNLSVPKLCAKSLPSVQYSFYVNLCYFSALLLLLSVLSLIHRQAEVTKKLEYSGLVAFFPLNTTRRAED